MTETRLIIAISILIFIGVLYIAAAVRMHTNATARSLKKMLDRNARLIAAVTAQTTVVAGVATAINGVVVDLKEAVQALKDSGADTAEVDAAIERIESNTGALAQAAAIATTASDEVHSDDGGTGDDISAVVPEPAPIEEPEEEAPVEEAPVEEAPAGEEEAPTAEGDEDRGAV